MEKFRKKPIIVEAEQFFKDKKPWPDGVKTIPIYKLHWSLRAKNPLGVENLDGGWYFVEDGDWIIHDLKRGIYTCNPTLFEELYEKI